MTNVIFNPDTFYTLKRVNYSSVLRDLKVLFKLDDYTMIVKHESLLVFIELGLLALLFKIPFSLQNLEDLYVLWDKALKPSKFRFSKSKELSLELKNDVKSFLSSNEENDFVHILQIEYGKASTRVKEFIPDSIPYGRPYISTINDRGYIRSFVDRRTKL